MEFFVHVSLGLCVPRADDNGDEDGDIGRKGKSCERTFTATDDAAELRATLAAICEHLSEDLRAEDLAAKQLTLKVKEATFEVRALRHVPV